MGSFWRSSKGFALKGSMAGLAFGGVSMGRHSAAEYRDALLKLLPQSRIWDEERKDTSGELFRLCAIWAEEYTLLEHRLYSLHSEASPLTATDLEQWAKATGVILLEGNKLSQRAQIMDTLIGSPASTKQGLRGIAQIMGYTLKLQLIGTEKYLLKLSSQSKSFQTLASEMGSSESSSLRNDPLYHALMAQ